MPAYVNLARLYDELGRKNEALEAINTAIHKKPEYQHITDSNKIVVL